MEDKKTNPMAPICTCIQDPFANLPPELRPKPVQKMGGLRKVTCPNCGLGYWTNRETDLCVECERKKNSALRKARKQSGRGQARH